MGFATALFTRGRYDGLPGMDFPGSPSSYPTKDETAGYLEAYARELQLPVRTGVRVDKISKIGAPRSARREQVRGRTAAGAKFTR
jgi:cation diffusion facilitator CzcD-associated flavoprotein CzcO